MQQSDTPAVATTQRAETERKRPGSTLLCPSHLGLRLWYVSVDRYSLENIPLTPPTTLQPGWIGNLGAFESRESHPVHVLHQGMPKYPLVSRDQEVATSKPSCLWCKGKRYPRLSADPWALVVHCQAIKSKPFQSHSTPFFCCVCACGFRNGDALVHLSCASQEVSENNLAGWETAHHQLLVMQVTCAVRAMIP